MSQSTSPARNEVLIATALKRSRIFAVWPDEALNELVEKLTANYHELETAVTNRVQLSREVLNGWQNETRSLMRELRRFSSSMTHA